MADKWKAKGTKPMGQQKTSARQHNDSGASVVADKENSETLNSVTPTSERPRPRPIKSIIPQAEHVERSERDEGAAMVVEALLSIQNKKPSSSESPATGTNLKAPSHSSSPMEHTFEQEDLPGPAWGCKNSVDIYYGIENGVDNIDQPEDDVKSSDEDGHGMGH